MTPLELLQNKLAMETARLDMAAASYALSNDRMSKTIDDLNTQIQELDSQEEEEGGEGEG